MKIRRSFFVRWLLSTDENNHGQTECSVIDIEHIQTGETRRVFSLEEAGEWMKTASEREKKARLIEAE